METVINFIKRFTVDLFHALMFAAGEYDVSLQQSKTQLQRALIWLFIGIVTIGILLLALWGIVRFLESIGSRVPGIES